MNIQYTEEQKRKALVTLIRNAAQESRIPQPVRNSDGELLKDPFAGPEFDVLKVDEYWKKSLVRAISETDALFVLERMTIDRTEEN